MRAGGQLAGWRDAALVLALLLVLGLVLAAGAEAHGPHPQHQAAQAGEAAPPAALVATGGGELGADAPQHRSHHDGTRPDCPICLALCLAFPALTAAAPPVPAERPARLVPPSDATPAGVPIRPGFRPRAPPLPA